MQSLLQQAQIDAPGTGDLKRTVTRLHALVFSALVQTPGRGKGSAIVLLLLAAAVLALYRPEVPPQEEPRLLEKAEGIACGPYALELHVRGGPTSVRASVHRQLFPPWPLLAAGAFMLWLAHRIFTVHLRVLRGDSS